MFLLVLLALLYTTTSKFNYQQYSLKDVYIFHLIDNSLWGEVDGSALKGNFNCNTNLTGGVSHSIKLGECVLVSSESSFERSSAKNNVNFMNIIEDKFRQYTDSVFNRSRQIITVSLYNIHTWGTLSRWPHAPDQVRLPTNYTIAESEESVSRFNKLFQNSFKHFDASSTTSPFSTIQRTYFAGLNSSEFIPMKPFHNLIKGASFVASTCHRGSGGTTKRLAMVSELQKYMRVDSLGKCLRSNNKEIPILLKQGKTALESLQLKRQAISHYLFYFAFENTFERGYVTEKVFDALIAGVVPVYLGSSVDCKPLLPDKGVLSAIFVDDFNNDMRKLAGYLNYLSENQTAYNRHRQWRADFMNITVQQQLSPMFQKSWPCRICEWAFTKSFTI